MSKKHKQYSESYESEVALMAILKIDVTTAEVAARFDIYPTTVSSCNREPMYKTPTFSKVKEV